MKIVVGEGSCGIAAGAAKVYDALAREFAATSVQPELTIAGCIGMCYLEPIVDIYSDSGDLTRLVRVAEADAADIARAVASGDLSAVERLMIAAEDESFLNKQTRIALRHCGVVNPENIDDYLGDDGYQAIKKVLATMTPEQVIEEIKISGLKGRGGAGFPTWFKWNAARSAPGAEKYLICNADEGDPGAFMDRAVIESDPHNLIEGMLIGAYAIGAKEAIVYVRAEYLLAIKRLPGGGTTDYAVDIYYSAAKKELFECPIGAGTFMDMMYMPDALRACIEIMEADPNKFVHRNSFNIASMSFDPEIIYNKIKEYEPDFKMVYKVDPLRQGIADSWPNSLDDTCAREEWGWKPEFDLDSMTRDMLAKLKERFNK